MFRGEKINTTEKRAVLHVALRAPRERAIVVDGKDVVPEVHAVLDQMADFAAPRPQRRVAGHTGQAHPQRRQHRHRRLGPRPGDGLRSAPALQRARPRRFASSPTSTGPTSSEATRDLDPAETLFIVSSKTFTTLETMANAAAARDVARLARARRRGARVAQATSSPSRPTPRRCARFGIDTGEHVRVLGLGRRALLDGLRDRPLDDDRDRPRALPRDAGRLPRHGRALPDGAVRSRTCPCCWASSASGTTNFFGAQTVAVLPYDQYLQALPRLPPAARHGEQRQARHPRRPAVRLPDGAGRLGRAGHQRPALRSTSSSTRGRSSSRATSSASADAEPAAAATTTS